ncbi:MAG: rhomboid family intramembrane serine protease [Phaeodactylibacter sp.]|nr:rhomboid family intramembrane serine protease [Phaeodactylibacter sp.]
MRVSPSCRTRRLRGRLRALRAACAAPRGARGPSSATSRRGSSLGASGAVFGLLVGYGMLFPENRIMLLFPPIPLKAKYFVLIYAGVELFMGLGNFNTGIAHYAHLGGALFGFLLILYWRKFGSRF